MIHTVKDFGIVNKAEIDVFLELSCFFDDPADVGNLISACSTFSKTSLNIWKFTVHVLLKPGLENFEHYFTSVWDECNCAVVRAFFGIAFLRDWNKNCLFPVLWPLLSFQTYSACVTKTLDHLTSITDWIIFFCFCTFFPLNFILYILFGELGSHFFFFHLDYASHVTLDTVWLIFLEHTCLSYTFSLVWEMIMLLIYLWKWLYGMEIGKSFLELHSHVSLTLALLETCLVIGFISFSMDSWSLYFCQREQLQCLIPGFTLPFLQ